MNLVNTNILRRHKWILTITERTILREHSTATNYSIRCSEKRIIRNLLEPLNKTPHQNPPIKQIIPPALTQNNSRRKKIRN